MHGPSDDGVGLGDCGFIELTAGLNAPALDSGRDPGWLTAGEGAGVKSSSTSKRVEVWETERLWAQGVSEVSVVKSINTSS